MPKNPQEFAELLGARIVGEVPDVGGGPFGMARLAHLLHARLTPSEGERPGRPTDATWESRPKIPMSEATQRRLVEIAEAISTPDRRVSPMQVAAHLLEEAVGRVDAKREVHHAAAGGPANQVDSEAEARAPLPKTSQDREVSKEEADADPAAAQAEAEQPIPATATPKQTRARRDPGRSKVRRPPKA